MGSALANGLGAGELPLEVTLVVGPSIGTVVGTVAGSVLGSDVFSNLGALAGGKLAGVEVGSALAASRILVGEELAVVPETPFVDASGPFPSGCVPVPGNILPPKLFCVSVSLGSDPCPPLPSPSVPLEFPVSLN